MVIHIALFAWKPETGSGDIIRALRDVRALSSKVNGVKAIYSGENYSRWAEGFTHAIVVLAEDDDALERYRKHPDHQAVAITIESMESKSIGVDFHSED